MARVPNQIVGNAGLYFVCYELTKRGWNVLPTCRNARGVDIVIYSEDARRTHTVQVKALSAADPVPLGASPGPQMANFFVICTKVMTDAPEVFVLDGREIAGLAHRNEKAGAVSYWLEPKSYAGHKDRWELIGTGYED
jgi:S-adenosylhomocysteine hydrolase